MQNLIPIVLVGTAGLAQQAWRLLRPPAKPSRRVTRTGLIGNLLVGLFLLAAVRAQAVSPLPQWLWLVLLVATAALLSLTVCHWAHLPASKAAARAQAQAPQA